MSFPTDSSAADDTNGQQTEAVSSQILAPSEELRLLRARIEQLERSSIANVDIFGQNGNESENEQNEETGQSSSNKTAETLNEKFAKMEIEELKESKQLCMVKEFENNAASDFANAIHQTKVTKFEGKIMGKMKQPKNYWDANKCQNEVAIYGPNNLTVCRNGKEYGRWHSVFAKYSILDTSVGSSGIFYFEILVKNAKYWPIFGIAVKHWAPLNEEIRFKNGTYAYGGDSGFYVNGSGKSGNRRFCNRDVVGFGVNLATKKMFFTKNGQHIGLNNLSISFSDHSANELFPFVSLYDIGDKIEANFGPKFKFDLSTFS